MPDRSEHVDRTAVAGQVAIARRAVALLLVPAAVVLGLYPLNWMLGTVSFYTASISLLPLRLLLIAPIIFALVLVWRWKDWLLAAVLVPGIALVLLGPDRIGSQQPNQADSKAFYPEHYAAAGVTARINEVERSINDAGWLFTVSLTRPPSLDKVRSFQTAANNSTAAWRDAGASIDQQRTALEQQLVQATARRTQVGNVPPPMDGGSFMERAIGNALQAAWQRQVASIDAEIVNLNARLSQLNAGAAAGNLYPAAVSATAALRVDLESLEREVAEDISSAKVLPYIVAASISFAIFVFTVGFRNWALAGLLLMTALACVWSAWPISLDDWYLELPLIFYPAFICCVSAFVLRFAFRGYLDNIKLNAFDRRHLVRSAARAILAWLPFPAVIIGVVWINNLIYSYGSSAIYCEGYAKQFCGSLTSEPPIQDSDPSRDTLRDDINAGIYRLLARFEAEAVREAEGARSNVAAQVNAVQTQLMGTYDKILPPNLYQIFPDLTPPSSCRWLLPDIKCFARKIALERLNAAYQSPRDRYRARLAQALADVGKRVTAGVMNAATGFQDAIKGQSQQAALYATKTVDATFVGLNALSVAQMALMLIVSMRALLLIFGRMLYRDKPSKPRRGSSVELPCLALTHSESESAAKRLKVTPHKDEFELDDDKYLPLLTKRIYNVDDADQVTLLLRARYLTWPFRRLANGCLILTEVTRSEGKKSIRFSTLGGRQLIVWTIPKDVEVFFRWDRFVAMTASMQIRKTVSLRIGGLATSTTMQASVVGPGLLIQESSGQVELTYDEVDPGSVFPSRLLSWVSGSQFRIKAPRPLSSVYFDPPSIDVARGTRAVLDSSGERRRGLGLLRELMRLCRP